MRRIKNARLMISFVLLVTIASATGRTVSASTDTWVVFGCVAAGRGFVLWDVNPYNVSEVYGYTASSKGLMACRGSAVVEGPYDGSYPALSGVGCQGPVSATWTHDGVRYRLVIGFHSTTQTSGLFIKSPDLPPPGEYFAIPIPETTPSEPEKFLSYRGILVQNRAKQPISGMAAIGASVDPETGSRFIVFMFGVEETAVAVIWTEDLTRVFQHSVMVLGS